MSEEEVFEYAPPVQTGTEEISSSKVSSNRAKSDAVVESSLPSMSETFAYFDAAALEDGKKHRTKYDRVTREAPRAKLARLQREAAELQSELEESPHSGVDLLHQVEVLIASLERTANGLPSTHSRSPNDCMKEAREAIESATQAAQTRAKSATIATDENVIKSDKTLLTALSGGPETAHLLAEAPTDANLPALLVTRLAALRTLHEQSFEFANRLRAAELEQAALRRTLIANDDIMARLATRLSSLLDQEEIGRGE